MSLSQDELWHLFETLNEKSFCFFWHCGNEPTQENEPLQSVLQGFQQAFRGQLRFRAACAVMALLQDNLLTEAQAERRFLSALLTGQSLGELLVPPAREALRSFATSSSKPETLPDLASARQAARSNLPRVPALARAEIRPIVGDVRSSDTQSRVREYLEQHGEDTRASPSAAGGAGGGGGAPPSSVTPAEIDAVTTRPSRPFTRDTAPRLDLASEESFRRAPVGPWETGRGQQPTAASSSSLAPSSSSSSAAAASVASSIASLSGFRPMFARPSPPLLHLNPEEFAWAGAVAPSPLLWDSSMARDRSREKDIQQLVRGAVDGTLDDDDRDRLLAILAEDSRAVFCSGLTPEAVPNLVENSPRVAIECLRQLHGSSQAADFYSALVTLKMSLHSMEVVNRLATMKLLPTDLIHVYVSSCITSCNSISDKYLQNRLVRLVCVFLHSLIQQGIIQVKDLYIEVQAFCIEFSRTTEANELFKLITAYNR